MAAAQKKMPTRNLETIIRAGVGPRAMPPDTVQVFKIADDVFSWEVSFEDESLDQSGTKPTFAEAWACVLDALANAMP
jgi:hypothetical protein